MIGVLATYAESVRSGSGSVAGQLNKADSSGQTSPYCVERRLSLQEGFFYYSYLTATSSMGIRPSTAECPLCTVPASH